MSVYENNYMLNGHFYTTTMRLRIFTLLLIPVLFFTSCQKDSIEQAAPITAQKNSPSFNDPSSRAGALHKGTAAVDTVNGYIRVQLAKDAINTDNVLISFNPKSHTKYVAGEDAPTFQGFGLVNLSSLSSDNIPLAINELPLPSTGATVRLKVAARTDGVYKLSLSTISDVPAVYSVWLIDGYKKDTLDIRKNTAGYSFSIANADTASFGSNRFKLIINQ